MERMKLRNFTDSRFAQFSNLSRSMYDVFSRCTMSSTSGHETCKLAIRNFLETHASVATSGGDKNDITWDHMSDEMMLAGSCRRFSSASTASRLASKARSLNTSASAAAARLSAFFRRRT
eukprot:CAMPEP_0118950470 /NCGR_PEP_ID=MMETSP1169-20130426/51435_1 /TAXON_ID=36882 /ORGANISM="Pyramimonas obovata, Strain CCMP722" /LENGTH=119 /DNA_ID=CAMNT_0006897319 /DNA_START=705 /DNA_END=1060 /DNA_ORIENTATION=+